MLWTIGLVDPSAITKQTDRISAPGPGWGTTTSTFPNWVGKMTGVVCHDKADVTVPATGLAKAYQTMVQSKRGSL